MPNWFRPQTTVQLSTVALLGAALLVTSCADDDDPVSQVRAGTVARYSPADGAVPVPNDLLFLSAPELADGTLNLPVAVDGNGNPQNPADPFLALNTVDGWSTVGPINIDFTRAIDPDSILDPMTMMPTGAIRMFEVTSAVTANFPVGGPVITADSEMIFGVDYVAVVSTESSVAIQPLRRLDPSQVGNNSVYMVVVTDALLDTDGVPVGKDSTFLLASEPTPFNNETTVALRTLQTLVNSQLNAFEQFEIANAMEPLDRGDVAVSFTFTTQSVGTALDTVFGIANGQEANIINGLCSALGTCDPMDSVSPFSSPIARVINSAVPLGTASELAGGPVGNALIYAGIFEAPYYLTAAENDSVNPVEVVTSTLPLTETWESRYAPAAGVTDRNLTRFNPLPLATSSQKMPMLVMTPDVPPATMAGYPVVIFQHGIGQNRTNLLGVAESLAAAGMAAVAIDLPLHGVDVSTGQLNGVNIFTGFRQSGTDVWERTFGLDLLSTDNPMMIPTPGQDGVADSSGSHFINFSDLAVSRDNLRQSVSDLVNLRAAISQLTIMGTDVFDENDVHFIGHSLGGIVGAPFIATQPGLTASTLGMAGGSIPYLLNGSQSFGPVVRAGLSANGVEEGTAQFNLFLAAGQTVLDTVDPINHAEDADAGNPALLMLEIVGGGSTGAPDAVVPNTVVGAPFAGTEPLAAAMLLPGISANTTNAAGVQGIVRFVDGDHSSLVSPGPTPDTGRAYLEMQAMISGFHGTSGQMVTIVDGTLVQ